MRLTDLGIIKHDNIELKVSKVLPLSNELNTVQQGISLSSPMMATEAEHSESPGDPVCFKHFISI